METTMKTLRAPSSAPMPSAPRFTRSYPKDRVSGRPVHGMWETREHYRNRLRNFRRFLDRTSRENRREEYYPVADRSAVDLTRFADVSQCTKQWEIGVACGERTRRARHRGKASNTRRRETRARPVKQEPAVSTSRVEKITMVEETGIRLPRGHSSGTARAERALTTTSRVVRSTPSGVGFVSSAWAVGNSWYHIFNSPELRSAYEELRQVGVLSSPGMALSLVLHTFVRSLTGPRGEYTTGFIRELIASNTTLRNISRAFDLEADAVFINWQIWEGMETFSRFDELYQRLGYQMVWVPMRYLSVRMLGQSGLWLAETALEIAARFAPPIGLALTVVDVLQAIPRFARAVSDHWQMHTELLNVRNLRVGSGRSTARFSPTIRVERQVVQTLVSTYSVQDGVPRVEHVPHSTYTERVTVEGIPVSQRVRDAAAASGLLVAAPAATGLALAGAGIAGGLTLAATPFLVGYEVTQRARGRRERFWHRWTNPPAAPTNVEFPSSSASQPRDVNEEVEQTVFEDTS